MPSTRGACTVKFEVVYKTLNQIKTGDIVLHMNDLRIVDWKRWTNREVESSRFKGPRSHIPRIIQIVNILPGELIEPDTRSISWRLPSFRNVKPMIYHMVLALNFNYSCQCQKCKEARKDDEGRFARREEVISDQFCLYTDCVYPVFKLD